MLTVELPPEMEERLEAIARKVGRTIQELAFEAVVEEIHELEAALVALERLRSGETEFYTLEDVRERLGLTD